MTPTAIANIATACECPSWMIRGTFPCGLATARVEREMDEAVLGPRGPAPFTVMWAIYQWQHRQIEPWAPATVESLARTMR
jgi:hypothetical protein